MPPPKTSGWKPAEEWENGGNARKGLLGKLVNLYCFHGKKGTMVLGVFTK